MAETARSYYDQATAKLVMHCVLPTDEFYALILYSRHSKYLFSLCLLSATRYI